jgi:hypothetical protein
MFTRTLPGGRKLMIKVAGGRRRGRRPRTVIVVFEGRRDRARKRRA